MMSRCLNDYEPRLVPIVANGGCTNCLFLQDSGCAVVGITRDSGNKNAFPCTPILNYRLVHKLTGEEVDPINLVQRAKVL